MKFEVYRRLKMEIDRPTMQTRKIMMSRPYPQVRGDTGGMFGLSYQVQMGSEKIQAVEKSASSGTKPSTC